MTRDRELQEEIARVAYMLFENSGRLHGRDMENWLEAKKMVMDAHAETKTGKTKKSPKARPEKNRS